MTPEEHRIRHVMLHASLDELIADWINHNPDKNLNTTTLMDFLHWSFRQTTDPVPDEEP